MEVTIKLLGWGETILIIPALVSANQNQLNKSLSITPVPVNSVTRLSVC